jgi:serine/threonine protein kinase
VQQPLGEGASGVIYQALWQRGERAQPVAVKLFKGTMTSDGLPQNEIAACLGAGTHPNLIAVHGQISHHPAGANGLVMALVAPRSCSLAAPPSLASCTRDIYAEDRQFTLAVVLRLAGGVASAACQLQARGIVHGDLYAHNILHSDDGQALLGDFGAASFFVADGGALALALQRIEVRAFACLLEELLARCQLLAGSPDDAQSALQALHQLQADCAQPDPAARPLFAEIARRLGQCGLGD